MYFVEPENELGCWSIRLGDICCLTHTNPYYLGAMACLLNLDFKPVEIAVLLGTNPNMVPND